jgi:O-antigen/teichoic acid export membrane protein
MRHPLRRVASRGAWYALGNALVKVSGLILLPVVTNTDYLSMADYGRWGVLEITAQLGTALLGLSLAIGLVRFYNEPDGGGRVVAAAWWTTITVAAGAALLTGVVISEFAQEGSRYVYWALLAYGIAELLLAIPLALLRAQERAGWHTAIQGLKLALLVSLALALLVKQRVGFPGLVGAFAAASMATLVVAVLATARREYFLPRISGQVVRRLLRFSVPLVAGGLGSMVLNAGDRYVLAMFRPSEDVAVYTLASRFGGVVNMFVVQPLNLAWLPLLFRLEERQRADVLRLLVPYLTFGLCVVVVALSTLTAPALRIMGSASSYQAAVPLIPWVGLGFAAYGLSTVFSGVLALFHRTRTLSIWLAVAAVLNLGLNFALVPAFGPMAAAINTLVGYVALMLGQYWATRKLLPVRYGWGRLTGMTSVTLAASLAGAFLHAGDGLSHWALRLAVVAGWVGLLAATRWFTWGEVREVWRVMRGTAQTPVPEAEGRKSP